MQYIDGTGPDHSLAPQNGTGALIKDGNIQSFVEDVLERSRTVPVLVDFWATWCEPCKTLVPLLEKLVTAAAGRVCLVKINVDENQQLATQMQIRSVPTVVAFVDGRPADGFTGALGEADLKAFIDKLTGPAEGDDPVEALLDQADELYEAAAYEQALGVFAQILQMDGDNAAAMAGVAQCFIKLGDLDQAAQILDAVTAEQAKHGDIVAAKAALQLALQVTGLGEAAPLQETLSTNPDDHETRFALALVLWAADQREEAADQLLEIIRRDRAWEEDKARKQLLQFFEVAGPMDPFTVAARRKLSSLLFS